jgi:hypothetical protein
VFSATRPEISPVRSQARRKIAKSLIDVVVEKPTFGVDDGQYGSYAWSEPTRLVDFVA